MLKDAELNKEVLELIGKGSAITFPVNCQYKFIAIHAKSLDRYFSIKLLLRDSMGSFRRIEMANNRSNVIIRNNSECLLPLVVSGGEVGWKMIKIDQANP